MPHNTPHSDHQNLHHSTPLNMQQTGPPTHNTQHSTSINIQQTGPLVHTKKLKAKKQLLNIIQNENTANDVEPTTAGISYSTLTPIIIKTNTSIHAPTATPQSTLRNLEDDDYIYDYETSDYYWLTSSPELQLDEETESNDSTPIDSELEEQERFRRELNKVLALPLPLPGLTQEQLDYLDIGTCPHHDVLRPCHVCQLQQS